MLRSNGNCRAKAGLAVAVMMGSVLISGCSPVASVRLDSKANSEGLIYHLPKQDIKITYKASEKTPTTIVVGLGAAYADLSERYVLSVLGTPTASRSTDVKVSSAGLLESASAKLESKVGTIAVEIAKDAAIPAVTGQTKNALCLKDVEYVLAIDPSAKNRIFTLCDVTITVVDIDTEKPNDVAPKKRLSGKPDTSGYFYRVGRPYRVTICSSRANEEPCDGKNNLVDKVVSTPSGAPIQFVPVSKAFFADNDSSITFSNGILTGYKESKGSELLGLTSIPAQVIGAYFEAAGKLLENLKKNDTGEVDVINSSLNLELAKLRYESCLAAIRRDDKAAIESFGCKSN